MSDVILPRMTSDDQFIQPMCASSLREIDSYSMCAFVWMKIAKSLGHALCKNLHAKDITCAESNLDLAKYIFVKQSFSLYLVSYALLIFGFLIIKS